MCTIIFFIFIYRWDVASLLKEERSLFIKIHVVHNTGEGSLDPRN